MVKRRYDRFLVDQDTGEVDQDVMRQSAFPELRHKLNIFVCFQELELAQKKLYANYRISNIYQRLDKIEFEGYLLMLFNLVKGMIHVKIEELKGIVTEEDAPEKYKRNRLLFEKLEKLEMGNKDFSVSTLLELKRFVLQYLHELGLTNLLLKPRDPMSEFADKYE